MSGSEEFNPKPTLAKEGEKGPHKQEPQISRRTLLGLFGLGTAAAAVGVYGGVKQNEFVREQSKVDSENLSIRKATILEKHTREGEGSAAASAATGMISGSIAGPGSAVVYGIGGAITGSINSEAKYFVTFKIDGIDGKNGTQTFLISEAQYRKWNKGDIISVKIITDPADPGILRWVQLEDQ